MKSPIQKYYDLETNGEIRWQWDVGFIVEFNWQPNNNYKESYCVKTWEEVEKVFEDKLKQLKIEFDEKWIDEQTKRYEKWLEDEK